MTSIQGLMMHLVLKSHIHQRKRCRVNEVQRCMTGNNCLSDGVYMYSYSKSVMEFKLQVVYCANSLEGVKKVLLIHSCQVLGITAKEAEKAKISVHLNVP